MSEAPIVTPRRLVSPSPEDSRKGIVRALIVVSICAIVGWLAPLGGWTIAAICIGFGALMSIGFDLRRLQRKHGAYEWFQFDDRRIERVMLVEPEGKETRRVIAYDALDRVDACKGSIGFYEIGNDAPEEIIGYYELPDRRTVEAILEKVRSKGIQVRIEDDSLDRFTDWSPVLTGRIG